jgi:hypothetical protein
MLDRYIENPVDDLPAVAARANGGGTEETA